MHKGNAQNPVSLLKMASAAKKYGKPSIINKFVFVKLPKQNPVRFRRLDSEKFEEQQLVSRRRQVSSLFGENVLLRFSSLFLILFFERRFFNLISRGLFSLLEQDEAAEKANGESSSDRSNS